MNTTTEPPHPLNDRWSRSVSYLRVSVTDRCNYHCTYCAPAEGWSPSPRRALLSFEELYEVISVMAQLGVERVRFTGGEPLLRKGLSSLIERVSQLSQIREIAITTNGHLLSKMSATLYDAGVRRLNISLDTFDEDDFERVTKGGCLSTVLRGIDEAHRVGFEDLQVNAVLSPDLPQNPDRWRAYTERCWAQGLTPRWIEVMPIGQLDAQLGGVSNLLVRRSLREALQLSPMPSTSTNPQLSRGPAQYLYMTQGPYRGHRVGFIDPMSDDGFCSTCNRARLTALGGLRACLADDREVDLKEPLRLGLHGPALIPFIEEALYGKRPTHLMTSDFLPSSIMMGIGG